MPEGYVFHPNSEYSTAMTDAMRALLDALDAAQATNMKFAEELASVVNNPPSSEGAADEIKRLKIDNANLCDTLKEVDQARSRDVERLEAVANHLRGRILELEHQGVIDSAEIKRLQKFNAEKDDELIVRYKAIENLQEKNDNQRSIILELHASCRAYDEKITDLEQQNSRYATIIHENEKLIKERDKRITQLFEINRHDNTMIAKIQDILSNADTPYIKLNNIRNALH